MICIHEEEITKKNLDSDTVLIVPSSNVGDIGDIVVGGKPFKFSPSDDTLSLSVTFTDEKVPVNVTVFNIKNAASYNLTVTYVNGNSVVYTVSKILLFQEDTLLVLNYFCESVFEIIFSTLNQLKISRMKILMCWILASIDCFPLTSVSAKGI